MEEKPTSTNAAINERARFLAHELCHKLGFDIHGYPPPSRRGIVRKPLLNEKQISLVLDVGANTGQYAKQMRSFGYKGRIVSFEPLAKEYEALARQAAGDSQWECRRLALGSVDTAREMHIAANSWSSSLLPMCDCHRDAAPESAYVGTQQVTVARLDSIAPSILKSNDRVWLKLDVQGYELEVLRGASSSLSQVMVLECELSLVPLYEGQLLFHQMLDHLESLGFAPLSFENGLSDPRSGRLLQVESVLVRQP
jgi:FkbM family methyltransferase